MDAFTEVEAINKAIAHGVTLTMPIWKGVYTPESRFQVVYALGPRLLKVQLLNADEKSWTKEIRVDGAQWNAILTQVRQQPRVFQWFTRRLSRRRGKRRE